MDIAASNREDFWRSRASGLVVQPFAVAVAQSAIPTLIADLQAGDQTGDLPIVFANASFLRVTGWDEAEVLGRNLHFLHSDPEAAARVAAEVGSGAVVSDDFALTRRDGSRFSARLDIAPVFDALGRPSMLFATLLDVSDRVEAERGIGLAEKLLEERTADFRTALERTELLSREVTHRTKNALALLAAIVAAKGRRAETRHEAEVLADIAGRVRAIGGLQGLLDGVKSEKDGIVLPEFLARLVADLDGSAGARVSLAGAPQVGLTAECALSLALCVTELVLNAQKHGFPDGRSGTVAVSAQVEDGRCVIAVEDDGVGLDDGFEPAASTGLGMQVLLDQAGRIGGQVSCGRGASGGARFAITFPV